MKPSNCPVCDNQARTHQEPGGVEVQCIRCGKFQLTDAAQAKLPELLSSRGGRAIALLSGWLREHPGTKVAGQDLDAILETRMPPVSEKAERLLLHLARALPQAGACFSIPDYPLKPLIAALNLDGASFDSRMEEMCTSETTLLGVGYCENPRELIFLLEDYLWHDRGLLNKRENYDEPYLITPAGWARIHELQQSRGTGADGFIAMWFGDEVKPASDAIYRAVELAGYHAVLMNREEHNNRIDDEIIARIRGSRFLVADLTGHRGGVYFEAGFALGLGLPVIWLVREDQKDFVHFDTRQYDRIEWKPDALDELERRLKNRIEATLGHGPLASAAAQVSD